MFLRNEIYNNLVSIRVLRIFPKFSKLFIIVSSLTLDFPILPDKSTVKYSINLLLINENFPNVILYITKYIYSHEHVYFSTLIKLIKDWLINYV